MACFEPRTASDATQFLPSLCAHFRPVERDGRRTVALMSRVVSGALVPILSGMVTRRRDEGFFELFNQSV